MATQKIKFPYEIKSIDPVINTELLQYFHGERTGFVQVGPENYFFPHKYKLEAESYYNFEARPNDVWIVTFPRSGTTWMQELIWLVVNKLDFETAKKYPLTQRFPFFEFPIFVHPDLKAELLQENINSPENCEFIEKMSKPGYEALSEIPTTQRRFIKSHFPFSLLPPSVMQNHCKIIYIMRQPKDVAVSYYHLNRLFRTQGYVGNFERFWNYFERGLNPWLPYKSHINEALAHRHFGNVLFLKYEDMVNDLQDIIKRVAKFLDCSITSEGIHNLTDHLNIENFRNNEQVNLKELRGIGLLNIQESGFVRMGGNKSAEEKEFVNNPALLAHINNWIRL